YWINWMTERHGLAEIGYTAIDTFTLPVIIVQETSGGGNYVTHPQLNDAVQELENADAALDARITALENFDYSELIPQSLLDDVAANKEAIEDHAELIDEAQDAILALEDDLAAHKA